MNQAMQYVSARKKQAAALLGLSVAAGLLWRWVRVRSRAFVIPGSRSTVPDETGHYDMDGVSFDDNCGVVVGSDGRTPTTTKAQTSKKEAKRAARDEKPQAAS